MQLFLDTHALLWWFAGDKKLSLRARAAINKNGNVVFVSAASAWEISTKYRIGKLPQASILIGRLSALLADQKFVELPVEFSHAERAGSLPGTHRDPFDRILVAQALEEELTLISNKRIFDSFGAKRIW